MSELINHWEIKRQDRQEQQLIVWNDEADGGEGVGG